MQSTTSEGLTFIRRIVPYPLALGIWDFFLRLGIYVYVARARVWDFFFKIRYLCLCSASACLCLCSASACGTELLARVLRAGTLRHCTQYVAIGSMATRDSRAAFNLARRGWRGVCFYVNNDMHA